MRGSLESVLFEDVSSLSWTSCSKANPKGYLFFLLPFVFTFFIDELGISTYLALGVAAVVAGAWYAFSNKVKWDNVILETRGGKKITFSVEKGEGMTVMEKIEEDKRNHVGKE